MTSKVGVLSWEHAGDTGYTGTK